jgi:hypothetical protein
MIVLSMLWLSWGTKKYRLFVGGGGECMPLNDQQLSLLMKDRYNLLNKNQVAWNFIRLAPEVKWCTLQAFEDGPDRGVRNVGQYKPDAGETPKSRHS